MILVSSTYALQAGSKETIYTIDDCETLTINVEGTEEIIQGEYSIENCANEFDNTREL